MQRNLILFLMIAMMTMLSSTCPAQEKKFAAYLGLQYSKTLYDATVGNNPWGFGSSFMVNMQRGKTFEPFVEINGDLYLEDDKVYRVYEDQSEVPEVVAISSLMAGGVFHVTGSLTLGMQAGPGFVNRRVLFGIKPSVGLYLSETKNWQLNLFFTNFFNREKRTGADFGSAGIAVRKRLFRF